MVYSLYFLFIILGGFLFNKKFSNIYIIIVLLVLWLIMGLRTIDVGADTQGYVTDFKFIGTKSYEDAIKFAFDSSEPLYWIISWLCTLFSHNYTVYLLVWSFFPIYSLYSTFKNELDEPTEFLSSIIVFFVLGLFAFYVAGIRQTAALSIILFSYKYIRDKRIIKFLLCIGVAFLFHNSSLIFLIALPLALIKFHWWYFLFIIAFFFLKSFISLDYITQIAFMFFDERFQTYGTVYESSQNTSALIMQILLLAICFPNYRRLIKKDASNAFLFYMSFIGLAFQSFSGLIAEFARVSFYFCMFDLILVPRSLAVYSDRFHNKIVYLLFVLPCVIYLFFLSSSNLPLYKSVLF